MTNVTNIRWRQWRTLRSAGLWRISGNLSRISTPASVPPSSNDLDGDGDGASVPLSSNDLDGHNDGDGGSDGYGDGGSDGDVDFYADI